MKIEPRKKVVAHFIFILLLSSPIAQSCVAFFRGFCFVSLHLRRLRQGLRLSGIFVMSIFNLFSYFSTLDIFLQANEELMNFFVRFGSAFFCGILMKKLEEGKNIFSHFISDQNKNCFI